MNTDLLLNFFPLEKERFEFNIFSRQITSNELHIPIQDPEIRRFDSTEYSLTTREGYTMQTISSGLKLGLTNWYIFNLLIEKCKVKLKSDDFLVEERGFRRRVSFILKRDKDGQDQLWAESYFLRSAERFGILVGFRFQSTTTDQMVRLKRSLSLDESGKENINYYIDHRRKLYIMTDKYLKVLSPLDTKEPVLAINKDPISLPFKRLATKQYLFQAGKQLPSQFNGINQFGPYSPSKVKSKLVFVFQEEFRSLAYDLYFGLIGKTFPNRFKGMEKVFNVNLTRDNIQGIVIADFAPATILELANRLSMESTDSLVVPIIIYPWSREDTDQFGRDTYFRLKHAFLSKGMPTQIVSAKKLRNLRVFEWAVANIALAIFGKLGGVPWTVDTRGDKGMILGIGQAHHISTSTRKIERFFAYTVLLDSSGLYKDVRILSKTNNRDEYLNGFRSTLNSIITEYQSTYDKFVVHSSFRIRAFELDCIKQAIDELKVSSHIVVMKFEDDGKYMGFAEWNNSKVPFESSYLDLGGNEYLVWFEGAQYHNPIIRRRIAKPMHIQFTYPRNGTIDQELYLQGAINLSGANWRGFNAKSLPISVYYAKLIADYYRHFSDLGLSELDLVNLPPWFL